MIGLCAPTQGIWGLKWWCLIRISFCVEFWTWRLLLWWTIADNKDEIPCFGKTQCNLLCVEWTLARSSRRKFKFFNQTHCRQKLWWIAVFRNSNIYVNNLNTMKKQQVPACCSECIHQHHLSQLSRASKLSRERRTVAGAPLGSQVARKTFQDNTAHLPQSARAPLATTFTFQATGAAATFICFESFTANTLNIYLSRHDFQIY